MQENSITISFCVTCRNRLWQLKDTLLANVKILHDTPHNISLVDFGSSDGLSDWVWSNFEKDIGLGKLRFFQVKNNVNWNMSKAKNLSHRISVGSYLFSLDADNFIEYSDISKIENAANLNVACHQFSGDYSDGSPGRIGMPKKTFFLLGGYDEGMLPMGGQDLDILRRLSAISCRIMDLGAPEKLAIQNSHSHKIAEMQKTSLSDLDSYAQMSVFNRKFSELREVYEGPHRFGGHSSYIGFLNGRRVLIDGFNNLHSVSWGN